MNRARVLAAAFAGLVTGAHAGTAARSPPDSSGITRVARLPDRVTPGAETHVIRYPSGGALVDGFLIRPRGRAGRLPLLVFCRGGITGGSRIRQPTLAWLARLACRGGFVVAATQYRRDDSLGGEDVHDVVRLAEAATREPGVEAGPPCLLGVSRGGTQALLAVHRGLRARAVAVVGAPFDLAEAHRRSGPMRRRTLERALGGPPAEGSPLWIERSPSTWAEEIATPLLVLHGDRDPVVPIGGARRVTDRLQAAGRTCRLVAFEGAGHLLDRGDQPRRRDQEILDWFAAHR